MTHPTTRPASRPERPSRLPYVRPMGRWWRRDPFFMRYMAREATAVIVALYAIELTVALLCLGRGEAAWNAFVQLLRSPLSVALHGAMLWAMAYHTLSWFEVMPKTMPMMFWGGKRVPAVFITRAGLAAAVIASVVLFALVWKLSA